MQSRVGNIDSAAAGGFMLHTNPGQLSICLFLSVLPAAIQREVEGKTLDYTTRRVMSLIVLFCFWFFFFSFSFFLSVVVQFAKGYCHSSGGGERVSLSLVCYRAVIVCLDCSSDIQQIKPGRRFTVISRRVNKGKKALNVMTAHYERTSGALKVTAGVCAARGRDNSSYVHPSHRRE